VRTSRIQTRSPKLLRHGARLCRRDQPQQERTSRGYGFNRALLFAKRLRLIPRGAGHSRAPRMVREGAAAGGTFNSIFAVQCSMFS